MLFSLKIDYCSFCTGETSVRISVALAKEVIDRTKHLFKLEKL